VLNDDWVNQQLNAFSFGDLGRPQQEINDCRVDLERRAGG
jgi:hypothetical protein